MVKFTNLTIPKCFLTILTISLLSTLNVLSTRLNYFGYHLYRFVPENNVLSYLNSEIEPKTNRFDANGQRMPMIDVWSEPSRRGGHAEVLVAPEYVDDFLDILTEHSVRDIKLIKANIQQEFTNEQNQLLREKRKRRRRRSVSAPKTPKELRRFDLFNYHRYNEIVDHLRVLTAYKPQMLTYLEITKTFEGRDLVGVKVTAPNSKKQKSTIFIDAGVHAREWIAPATALYMLDRLVNEYETNSRIQWVLEEFDFIIVPVANPDGYEHSFKDRIWRKTRSRNNNVSHWCVGADANRNWAYRWGEAGANRSPCSNIYAGQKAFSEPESLGLMEFIKNKVHDLKVYASLHAYGQVFLSPWGFTNEKPSNYRDQQLAARYAVESIQNTTGAKYTYGSISEVMYPASGTSIDYMQNLGVPYIYGIELRPEDSSSIGFAILPNQIEPTGREMMAAFIRIAEYVKGMLPKRKYLKRKRQ
ncbi:Carboxypeptidase A1 [Aphelenchoides besseyi]|nr:Carboxypeptidase A1 [Aphelenchoides besseyi]KAI6228307.1 Carboxypeptidase A1 [Aphelenchoides besseyi]